MPVLSRPSLRTEAVESEICERLASGEPLIVICLDSHLPGYSTVSRWLSESPEFRDKIARAREDQSDYFVDQSLEIADKATPETAAVARLQVETRMKYAAKCKPKKWGDKTNDVNVAVTNNFLVISEAQQKEIQERTRQLLTEK